MEGRSIHEEVRKGVVWFRGFITIFAFPERSIPQSVSCALSILKKIPKMFLLFISTLRIRSEMNWASRNELVEQE